MFNSYVKLPEGRTTSLSSPHIVPLIIKHDDLPILISYLLVRRHLPRIEKSSPHLGVSAAEIAEAPNGDVREVGRQRNKLSHSPEGSTGTCTQWSGSCKVQKYDTELRTFRTPNVDKWFYI